jgi:hypothetical protein
MRWRRVSRRSLLLAVAVALTISGVAMAVGGLLNPSFEQGFSSWTARTIVYEGGVRDVVYDSPQPSPECEQNPDPTRICLIDGTDDFTVQAGGAHPISVSPSDGSKMVRLGGPLLSSGQRQKPDLFQELSQTFQVDPEQPILQLNFNIYTWDYQGFDDLEFLVTLTDGSGDPITEFHQGSFGSGTDLKSTGWQPAYVDLSGYEGEQVRLRISAGGTQDSLYGLWAYIDAGLVEDRPVGVPSVDPPNLPGTGTPAPVYSQTGINGQTEYWIPFGGGFSAFGPGTDSANGDQAFNPCMDLPISVPIDPGAGVLSDVKLLLDGVSGTREFPMSGPGVGNVWSTTIECLEAGDLYVSYTLTEEGESQQFLVPIGGLTLVDPSGVVYDKAVYDQRRAEGATVDEARAAAAIVGAAVRLQRQVGGGFRNVLSGDPGISPNVNPQVTGDDGRYAWDVDAGTYRVVVKKDGYLDTTSPAVTVPPEVTDLHVALSRPGSGGQTPPSQSVVPPAGQPKVLAKPCAGLKARKLIKCTDDLKVAKQCGKLKRAKKKTCAKRVRAISGCKRLSAVTKRQKAKRKTCLRQAKQIGKKKKKSKGGK